MVRWLSILVQSGRTCSRSALARISSPTSSYVFRQRAISRAVLDLFSCSSCPISAKKLCVDMFSKNYSPSLYFPLMYISPYCNQGFCRPPDHSHLKLPWIQIDNRIHPLPSKPLLHHHHQNKQHLISPRHSALSSVYKKREKKRIAFAIFFMLEA